MQKNPFANAAYDVTTTARYAFAITPANSDLTSYARALYVGTAGDVTVDMIEEGTNVLFKSLAVGWHPIAVKRVYATGTTALNIVGVQ